MANYLYNGVELPEIPETDYQYAIIIYHINTYELYLSNQQFVTTNYRKDNLSLDDYGAYTKYTLNNDEWGEPYNSVSSSGGGIFSSSALNRECFIWANHAFYYDPIAGSIELILQANEPVPVDSNTFNIRSFQIGIAVGLGLKGNFIEGYYLNNFSFQKGIEIGQKIKLIPIPEHNTNENELKDGTLFLNGTINNNLLELFTTPLLNNNGDLIL